MWIPYLYTFQFLYLSFDTNVNIYCHFQHHAIDCNCQSHSWWWCLPQTFYLPFRIVILVILHRRLRQQQHQQLMTNNNLGTPTHCRHLLPLTPTKTWDKHLTLRQWKIHSVYDHNHVHKNIMNRNANQFGTLTRTTTSLIIHDFGCLTLIRTCSKMSKMMVNTFGASNISIDPLIVTFASTCWLVLERKVFVVSVSINFVHFVLHLLFTFTFDSKKFKFSSKLLLFITHFCIEFQWKESEEIASSAATAFKC